MEQLRSALESITREAINSASGAELSGTAWYHLVRAPSGSGYSISYKPEIRPDWHMLLTRLGDVAGWPDTSLSFERVLQTIRSDEALAAGLYRPRKWQQPAVSDVSWPAHVSQSLIVPFLHTYLSRVNGLMFDEQVFEQIYNQLITDWKASTIPVVHVTALANVQLTVDKIILEPAVRLHRPSWDEIEAWFNWGPPVPAFERLVPLDELISVGCVVQVDFELPKRSEDPHDAWPQGPRETVEKVVRLLRLITGAPIRVLLSLEQSNNFFFERDTSMSSPILRVPRLRADATVGASEADRLMDLWRHLQSSVNADQIELALNMWDAAIDRTRSEERLIDYWTGLESLFTPEDDAESITRRVSQRIARFLGADYNQRRRIYDDIKDSYALRSKVVHGATAHPNKSTRKLLERMPELTDKTRDYLREALVKILVSPIPFDAKAKAAELDDELLRG